MSLPASCQQILFLYPLPVNTGTFYKQGEETDVDQALVVTVDTVGLTLSYNYY